MKLIIGILKKVLVCLCQGVSDRQVRRSIANGASTRKQVTRACGAGAGCGGCHRSIREIIVEHGQPARETAVAESAMNLPTAIVGT